MERIIETYVKAATSYQTSKINVPTKLNARKHSLPFLEAECDTQASTAMIVMV